jgi:hypothetical protein
VVGIVARPEQGLYAAIIAAILTSLFGSTRVLGWLPSLKTNELSWTRFDTTERNEASLGHAKLTMGRRAARSWHSSGENGSSKADISPLVYSEATRWEKPTDNPMELRRSDR